MNLKERILRKESLSRYITKDNRFLKTLSAGDLIALGVGAVIGAGIFILPGTVAAMHTGPSIVLSFILAAVVCSTAALCYAEFSAALPIAGSAYSFGTVVFGEIIGWFLGWALILEYMLAVAAVSTGWAAYLKSFLLGFGIHIPKALSGNFDPAHGTYINLAAVLIIVLISFMLSKGVKSSIRINNIIVLIKIAIIALFLIIGAFYVKPANWHPFMPFGVNGVFVGASSVFFAYLGFDVVSASAAEVKNPRRNMPLGILGTLVICTVLYILVSVVLTGMVSYTKLNVADPVSFALQAVNQNWVAGIISIGALAGMFTMMVTMIYSSSRLIYSIGRDGLLPAFLGKINAKSHTPNNSMLVVTIIIATMGGLVSLNQLANLVNIGTLIAFTFVSFGVIPLRKRDDISHDGFKVPFYPVLPVISGILCIIMMTRLSAETWIASIIWFIIGMILYFTYGIKHSKLAD
ncbi:MAG: amino acid permease [Liquorilactobacillus hordei]|uniref:Amino acid permease n=2 Tax=Liquorilactobacillus hordei TaxID=468911 RepID=A0A0R1MTY0_9LACO|nr:amino acid permease [Liquorilactobacillus hordei]AUJ28916.1 amino acid permease [Liquorilactobacillus hordei]KRL07128.1 amino acid permease [Liquorilactobacillus hordei DSM 19519]MBZ2406315.1 amino acid permease [Liquorilactobacillus hordei]QYH51614.1 amino acid permease [Liquorilactobacillus hordei DSM 19519]